VEARRDGRTVTLAMSVKDAAALQDELLWSTRDDDSAMDAAWNALSELDEQGDLT
jgi:hypothetical protein